MNISQLLVTLKMLNIEYEIIDNKIFIINSYLGFNDPEGFNILKSILRKYKFKYSFAKYGYDYLLHIIIKE